MHNAHIWPSVCWLMHINIRPSHSLCPVTRCHMHLLTAVSISYIIVAMWHTDTASVCHMHMIDSISISHIITVTIWQSWHGRLQTLSWWCCVHYDWIPLIHVKGLLSWYMCISNFYWVTLHIQSTYHHCVSFLHIAWSTTWGHCDTIPFLVMFWLSINVKALWTCHSICNLLVIVSINSM